MASVVYSGLTWLANVALGATAGAAAALGYYGAAALGAVIVAGGARLAVQLSMPNLDIAVADNARSRQTTVRSTVEPMKLVYGQALVSGPISFVGTAGTDNTDLYHQIALAGHEVEDITDIYFDDSVISDSEINSGSSAGGNVTAGTFAPLNSTTILKINKHLGTSTQTADTDLVSAFTQYTSAHTGKGIANIVVKMTMTDEAQKLWDQRQPNDIKALVKGKKDIYDPRLDTSAGANPTSSSYQAWTDNPALCVADYLLDTRFGLGITASKINWSAVVTAANACDATVSIPGSTTEKRFTANGVLFATNAHRNNLDMLLSAMNGSLAYSSGQYTIRAGVYEAPTHTLTEDDLTGPIGIRTSVERSQRFNKVTGVFVNPAENHKSMEFPAVQLSTALARDNNETLAKNIKLPMTNTSYMAQRIANKMIQLSDDQKVISFPCNMKGLKVAIGDRVQITVSDLSYSNKVFRCAGWSFADDDANGVNLTLVEENSSSYADPAVSDYSTETSSGVIQAGFPGVPDPSNLTATAAIDSIELNWTNPTSTSKFKEVAVYASPDSSWTNKVEIGRTMGTQFIHDASTAADAITAGTQRYYWVRALSYGAGTGAGVESDRNPDSDTSTVQATAGVNAPNLSAVVDNTGTQDPPTNLILSETTVVANDGSVQPAVLVRWTAPTANTYVDFYDVEYKRTSSGELDYGLVADSYTSTIDYDSVATATTVEINYGGVSEPVTGAGAVYSSTVAYSTDTTVHGVELLQELTIRVRAHSRAGKVSSYITGTITLQGDQTAPGLPGSVTATAGYQQITLNWNNPTDSDFGYVEIFESTTNNINNASLLLRTPSDNHTIAGLGDSVTRYYYLRSADRSGNTSAFTSAVSATTSLIPMDSFTQSVKDAFTAGNAFGIEPVSTLSGVTGDHVGQVKLLTTTDTLYVWTGSAWSTDIFTASNVDPGSITAASFASGVEPISAVSSLPTASGYTGPAVIFNTSDKKLYRYDSSIPEFTTLISTTDLSGTIGSSQFSTSLRPIEVVSSLPTTSLTQGRVVMLTTDNKIYRYNGTSWVKTISAADLDDQLNAATQIVGQLPVANASAGLKNSGISINADGTLNGAGSGQVTLSGLNAGALAAQDTVNLSSQVAGELSTAYAAAGLKNASITINADGTLSGAGSGQVSLSGLNAGALASLNTITETEITDGSISTAKIQANAIEAAKINVNEVFADSAVVSKIVAETITAANVKAVLISTDKLTANEISSNTLTSDLIVARTIVAGDIALNTLTAAEIAANTITATEIAANTITASQIAANTLTANEIAANTITATQIATDTITANEIGANAITASELNVSSVFADSAVIGAIQTSAITASAITSTIANVEFVEAVNIASDAITAGKIATNAVTADSINVSNLSSISADLGTVTAGTINGGTINAGNLSVTGTFSAGAISLDTGTMQNSGGNLTIVSGGVATSQIASNAVSNVVLSSDSTQSITTLNSYVTVADVSFTASAAATVIAFGEFNVNQKTGSTLYTANWAKFDILLTKQATSGSDQVEYTLASLTNAYIQGINSPSFVINDSTSVAASTSYTFRVKVRATQFGGSSAGGADTFVVVSPSIQTTVLKK